jgi:hypothetical protein
MGPTIIAITELVIGSKRSISRSRTSMTFVQRAIAIANCSLKFVRIISTTKT